MEYAEAVKVDAICQDLDGDDTFRPLGRLDQGQPLRKEGLQCDWTRIMMACTQKFSLTTMHYFSFPSTTSLIPHPSFSQILHHFFPSRSFGPLPPFHVIKIQIQIKKSQLHHITHPHSLELPTSLTPSLTFFSFLPLCCCSTVPPPTVVLSRFSTPGEGEGSKNDSTIHSYHTLRASVQRRMVMVRELLSGV